MTGALTPAQAQLLAQAHQCLARRDVAGAEAALVPLMRTGHPDMLSMLGAVRLFQGRLAEAVDVLTRGRAAAPRDAGMALNLGRALGGLGRLDEAEAALRDALALQRDSIEARFELAALLHRRGQLDEAENLFRAVLRTSPALTHALLALGAVLVDQGRADEAETLLRRALIQSSEPGLTAQIQLQLGTALRRQRKDAEALAAADAARALAPHQPLALLHRAEALENLGRDDEAIAALRELLARAPADPGLHHAYNAMLHRLGRDEEFLRSYDRAPPSRTLLLGKAHFLGQADRHEEAHAVYARLLAQDGNDVVARIGAARALTQMKRGPEALAAYAPLLGLAAIDPALFAQAGEAALIAGDAREAARLSEEGLRRAPHHGACLATLSTAWRLLEDERDEALSGYDRLVAVIDLPPPEGFSNMADFNAELDAALDRLHPGQREFLGQSLRGGTQTPADLFAARLPLVDKLKARIDQAVADHIAALPQDAVHPFLSRRRRGFRHAGSWSSRLRDRGFHVNHIHPQGWISSCYYVAVPPAVADEQARQGWIKFGEPAIDVPLKQPVRRAIQPMQGRLILFPSYLWHGTIAFHDAAPRTTIAFDVVPTD